jgi:hypothetical protein
MVLDGNFVQLAAAALRIFLTGPDLKLNLNPIKAGFSRLGDLGYDEPGVSRMPDFA